MRHTTRKFLLSLFIAALAGQAHADLWAFFKFGADRTSSNTATLTPRKLTLKWTAHHDSAGTVTYASPIIADDRLFIGSTRAVLEAYDVSPPRVAPKLVHS